MGPEEGDHSTVGQGRRAVSQFEELGSPIAHSQTLAAHCLRCPIMRSSSDSLAASVLSLFI